MRRFTEDTYQTSPAQKKNLQARVFLSSSLSFYPRFFYIVWKNSKKALKGVYTPEAWADSSLDVLQALENVGVRIEVTGIDNIRKCNGPAVFIANHMSTLETMVLPCLVQPIKPVTFVVKESLVKMPVFGPVMRSQDPIVVGRKNPREDLRSVLEGGARRLGQGQSIIIFPQSTRSSVFDPLDFNSLGIKLALKAGVPAVPIALKTDAWGIGKMIKDFGPIDISRKVYFSFGEHMIIKNRGAEEHQKVIGFITNKLKQWNLNDRLQT